MQVFEYKEARRLPTKVIRGLSIVMLHDWLVTHVHGLPVDSLDVANAQVHTAQFPIISIWVMRAYDKGLTA